jgi:2,4-dienoyl-CoA reductase-like NADH-dependent reductase (Old Yellow Enzyme family)
MASIKIGDSLKLPCGAILKNRIAKSAMSENMGSKDFTSNEKFVKLYERWALGGSGLLITGNVMVDSRFLGEPNNIVIENGFSGLENLKKWARAGTENRTHLWMQLNHPGKQSPKFLCAEPVAPSAIAFESNLRNLFNKPRALSEIEILDLINRFTVAAKTAKEAGFTGVQIHGAHGYLVSQFLSPRHNQRTDQWGGSLENRMRFVIEIYKSMRLALGSSFPISIKMNSADFQKGGFGEDESFVVAQKLSEIGMDLIEISGGTYEAPAMTGAKNPLINVSTKEREAYFLVFCEKVRSLIKTPLMLTGGFRSLSGMEAALESNVCDIVGLGRSIVINPNFANQLLKRENQVSEVRDLSTGFRTLDKIFPLEIIWYTHQIQQMGLGNDPNPNASALATVIRATASLGLQSLKRVRA